MTIFFHQWITVEYNEINTFATSVIFEDFVIIPNADPDSDSGDESKCYSGIRIQISLFLERSMILKRFFIRCIGIIFCQIYIVDLLLTLTFRLIYINSHVWNFLLM